MFNNMLDELKEVKYFKEITDFKNRKMKKKNFKEIKRLKSPRKAEACLVPTQASMMELFCEYTQRLTIFAIEAPSYHI